MLESRVLVGEDAYDQLRREVVEAYWRNADQHPHDYLPYVLVNDIVRYWRILLVNHEAKLTKEKKKLPELPDLTDTERKERLTALRRYNSQKLRFACCLTCFSALTYLLALTPDERSEISQDQVHEMIGMTPLARLQALEELSGQTLPQVARMLDLYGAFLVRMNEPKSEVVQRLTEDDGCQWSRRVDPPSTQEAPRASLQGPPLQSRLLDVYSAASTTGAGGSST